VEMESPTRSITPSCTPPPSLATLKRPDSCYSSGGETPPSTDRHCSPTFFTTDDQHVTLVCENLINAGKFDRLERFIWAVPATEKSRNAEIILIAKSYLAFRSGQFELLYELLQRRPFAKKYHRQLQYLWRTARYIEAERARGRALGSVGKYRIRRKFPLPYTIWDGECMSYCFREEAREILNAMYKRTPYPTAQEK
uniref:Homeobox protein SIX1 N-terminal SD domain-containing protein n=2 Tax=Clytia hemisphaerica TaxID=252671 RepID=A0A7M5XMS6_9CNID